MKKLRHIFIFMIIVLILASLTACENTDPRKDYKTAKPSYISSKNIFYFNRSEIKNAYFTAKKVLINNDFSAEITYEIKDKSLEKEDTEEQPANSVSKDNIIKAIENYNKEKIYSDDSKLFEDYNRVLYLDEDSIKEEVTTNQDGETTNIVLNIYVTNLSYVCNSYKLMSLEDYIKAEDERNLSNPLEKRYYHFFNFEGKSASIVGEDLKENYKLLVLENYSPSINTEFVFEGKIMAYYNYADKVSKTDAKSITISSSGSYTAVMYQINQTQPINWAILGPVIGVITVFVILVNIKIIQTAKKRKSAKGK